jgi:hypothetical protein
MLKWKALTPLPCRWDWTFDLLVDSMSLYPNKLQKKVTKIIAEATYALCSKCHNVPAYYKRHIYWEAGKEKMGMEEKAIL